jgi:putative addiction module component (TIGR02574 family)
MGRSSDVRAAALQLSEQERLELATELLESVEGTPDPEWERAWIEEIDRRVSAARKAGAPSLEWGDVRARLLARFAR